MVWLIFFFFGVLIMLKIGTRVYHYVTKIRSFKNKVCVITGGARGIGKKLGELMLKEGSIVVLWDVNEEGLKKTVHEFKQKFTKCKKNIYSRVVDVSNREMVFLAAKEIQKGIGKVDILINNAGIVAKYSILKCPPKKIEQVIRVNLLSHFWTIQAFLPDMLKHNNGHIVCMSSMAGVIGMNGLAEYSSTKFALVGMMESISTYLNNMGSKVNTLTVLPNFTKTGMIDEIMKNTNILTRFLNIDNVCKKVVNAIKERRRFLYIPWYGKYVAFGLRLLFPDWLATKIRALMGINTIIESALLDKKT